MSGPFSLSARSTVLHADSFVAVAKCESPFSWPVPHFHDEVVDPESKLEGFLAGEVRDIVCYKESGVHEYLLMCIHLQNEHIPLVWVRTERHPARNGSITLSSSRALAAQDTIRLSYDRSKLWNPIDENVMATAFGSLQFRHVIDLLHVVHNVSHTYGITSYNCWWYAAVTIGTLRGGFGRVWINPPKRDWVKMALRIFGKDTSKATRLVGDTYVQRWPEMDKVSLTEPQAWVNEKPSPILGTMGPLDEPPRYSPGPSRLLQSRQDTESLDERNGIGQKLLNTSEGQVIISGEHALLPKTADIANALPAFPSFLPILPITTGYSHPSWTWDPISNVYRLSYTFAPAVSLASSAPSHQPKMFHPHEQHDTDEPVKINLSQVSNVTSSDSPAPPYFSPAQFQGPQTSLFPAPQNAVAVSPMNNLVFRDIKGSASPIHNQLQDPAPQASPDASSPRRANPMQRGRERGRGGGPSASHDGPQPQKEAGVSQANLRRTRSKSNIRPSPVAPTNRTTPIPLSLVEDFLQNKSIETPIAFSTSTSDLDSCQRSPGEQVPDGALFGSTQHRANTRSKARTSSASSTSMPEVVPTSPLHHQDLRAQAKDTTSSIQNTTYPSESLISMVDHPSRSPPALPVSAAAVNGTPRLQANRLANRALASAVQQEPPRNNSSGKKNVVTRSIRPSKSYPRLALPIPDENTSSVREQTSVPHQVVSEHEQGRITNTGVILARTTESDSEGPQEEGSHVGNRSRTQTPTPSRPSTPTQQRRQRGKSSRRGLGSGMGGRPRGGGREVNAAWNRS